MSKGNLAADPRGLIYESYRIDGIVKEDCRSIFLDWVLGQPLGDDMDAAIATLKNEYVVKHPDHPMSEIITEGLSRKSRPKTRRQGRMRRQKL